MSMNNVVPAQLLLHLGNGQKDETDTKREKINAWKKKAWLDFCKMVMESDKRYTLLPLSDYHSQRAATTFAVRLSKANGVFGNFCLRRDGAMTDVFIVPLEPQLGLQVDAGSKYINMNLSGYPSKSMVWPVIRIADDLERQFNREVAIESNKHGNAMKVADKVVNKPRRKYAKRTNSSVSNDDSNQLPTSSESDGQ